MDTVFKLPGSSYKELIKIIQGYATCSKSKRGTAVQLSELSQGTGISRTIISRNNGFLVQVGLVTEGSKKNATDLCQELASAYLNNIADEIKRIWRLIVEKDAFLTRMLSYVETQEKVERSDFVDHIVHYSGVTRSNNSKSGAATIIDIFKIAGFAEEHDGKISVNQTELLNLQLEESEAADTDVEESNTHLQLDHLNSVAEKNNICADGNFFVQAYTCEAGKEAKIIIPTDATQDDLLMIRDMFLLLMKRKYKLPDDQ